MKTSSVIVAIFATLFAMLPQPAQSQAQANNLNNLCGACTGTGYYYCPTTGVCYDPNFPISNVSIPVNSTQSIKLNSAKILQKDSVELDQVRLTQTAPTTCNCTTACQNTTNGTVCTTNCTGTGCTNKPANCTGTWNGTACSPTNCTGANCTQPVQWNVTYYTCPVVPFTPFNNPCRANFPCDAGVNGVLQLGMENDSYGQIDATNPGKLDFLVTPFEPCFLTIENGMKQSRVRLNFTSNNTNLNLARL